MIAERTMAYSLFHGKTLIFKSRLKDRLFLFGLFGGRWVEKWIKTDLVLESWMKWVWRRGVWVVE